HQGQFDFRFDLALDDAIDVVFDGVFGGDEFGADIVQFSKGGIERGGFTATGGAGDDTDTVGPANELANLNQLILADAELVEIEIDVTPIEHAHDDAFAEHGGEDADAKVDGLVVDAEFDAAVLGHSAFGDVEVGH